MRFGPLLIGHCAGMLDLVALPVWVGTLMGSFGLDAQQAGGLVTLFLLGQVLASLVLAPRLPRLAVRWCAVLGFAVAMLAFLGAASTRQYALMAVLHALGGMGAGCGLSMTHGCMGRSERPHRLFAAAQFALALMGIAVLGGGPKLVQAQGGPALFLMFAAVMAAAVAAALLFPTRLPLQVHGAGSSPNAKPLPLPRAVWFGMAGIGCLSLAQAMIFSFAERIGVAREYGVDVVAGVLIAVGIVNLLPGPLAALLEHRWSAVKVVRSAPVLHALLVLLLTQVHRLPAYAMAVMLLVCVLVFAHTFLFGLLARLDSTGRAVAATPAMLMIGSSLGPLLGGTVVKLWGYGTLGWVVAGVGLVALWCFSRLSERNGVAPLAAHAA